MTDLPFWSLLCCLLFGHAHDTEGRGQNYRKFRSETRKFTQQICALFTDFTQIWYIYGLLEQKLNEIYKQFKYKSRDI